MVLVGRCPKPATIGESGEGIALCDKAGAGDGCVKSSDEQEVAQLERLLVNFGVETRVSKKSRELRVAEWLQTGSQTESDSEDT